jgi:hypothetical protein
VGSTFAENNGNLATIYGAVSFEGHDGNDRLYFNDFGRGSSFNYDVGPSYVRNAGGPNSNGFAGVTYDGTVETLRLDATNYRNQVNVIASFDTRYNFFGEGGYNTITLLGDPNSDGREFFGTNGVQGFWNFDNGMKDVFFKDFFII